MKREKKIEVRLTEIEWLKATHCATQKQINVAEWVRQMMRQDPDWDNG
jgi:hypothetical protein